jgi:CRP-like cAMP-binding protein
LRYNYPAQCGEVGESGPANRYQESRNVEARYPAAVRHSIIPNNTHLRLELSALGDILSTIFPMISHTKTQSANQLLNALEPAAFERVAKRLTRKRLRQKEVVYKPEQPIDHVLFPENAILCLMTVMSNGDTIEAGTVGREGASWISASVGAPSMPCETIVVIEGTAHSLPIADLDRELKENGHFRDVLTEYSHALLVASMRTSACNGLHGLRERCARWMLTTLDRVDTERFAVTKEFLAQLLGTNRPTVSIMVSVFEKAGILNVEGRWVTVADRDRLKETACECYDVMRRNYAKVGR